MQPHHSRRYRILEILGAGGFGTVYRAELVTGAGLRREVALKVLNDTVAGSEEAAARLRDEARILSNLNYMGIVRVDDLLLLEDRWTMVMEFVRGADLECLLRDAGALPASVALEVAEAVARTLQTVAQARDESGAPMDLVHRDIKPANILMADDGVIKLLDFGVARAEMSEREAHTQKFIVMGSLPYLAPERYGFMDLPAGDVYGLGCVLYEMLTGEAFGRTQPFANPHRERLRDALRKAWELVLPDYREELLQVLAAMLAFDPDLRPAPQELAPRISRLRRQVPGPSLSEWATANVAKTRARLAKSEADALCGAVLLESDSKGTLVVTSAAELQDSGFPASDSLVQLLEESPFGAPAQIEAVPPSWTQAKVGDELVSADTLPPDRAPAPAPPDSNSPLGDNPENSVEIQLSQRDLAKLRAESPPQPPYTPEPTSVEQAPPDEPEGEEAASTGRSLLPLFIVAVLLFALGAAALTLLTRPDQDNATSPLVTTPLTLDVLQDDLVDSGLEEPPADGPEEPTPQQDAEPLAPVEPLSPVERTPAPSRVDPAPQDDEDTGSLDEAPAVPTRNTTPEPEPEPEPEPAPEPEPEPEPDAEQGIVIVKGTVDFARLRGPGGSAEPGPIAAGTYTLFPSFPGGFTVKGPTFAVAAGQTVVFVCDEGSRTCTREN